WLATGDTIPDINRTVSTQLATDMHPLAAVSGGRVLQKEVLDDNTSQAMLFGAAGDIHTLAMTGTTVPGLASGVSINSFVAAQANDAGIAEFSASLQGAGITSDNDMAWFAYVPGSGLEFLFQEGGTLTTSNAGTISVGNQSTVSMGQLNNSGELVFTVGGTG